MDLKRVYSILDNKEKCDIFYDDRPVWIQGVNENIAKVGFIDNFEEKDVFIDDLYERNLYNQFLNYNIIRMLSPHTISIGGVRALYNFI